MKSKVLIFIFAVAMLYGVWLAFVHTRALLQTKMAINLNESCAVWSINKYAEGESPYSRDNFLSPEYNFEVHPPLYFFLAGKIARLCSNENSIEKIIRIGRILNLFLAFIVICCVWFIMRRFKVSVTYILLSLLLLMSSFYFIMCSGRLQPDIFGITLSILGLCLVLREEKTVVWTCGLILCSAAFFAKQAYFGSILAIILFYLLRKEYKRLIFVTGVFLIVLFFTVGIFLIENSGAFLNLFCLQKGASYTLNSFFILGKPFIVTFIPALLVIFILVNIYKLLPESKILLIFLYFMLSGLIAVFSLPKEGAGFYYLLEVMIPMVILWGVIMQRLESVSLRKRNVWMAVFLFFFLTGGVQSIIVVGRVMREYKEKARIDTELKKVTRKYSHIIYKMPDHIMRIDKPVFIADVFSFRRFLFENAGGLDEFKQSVCSGKYDLLILENKIEDTRGICWDKKILETLESNYTFFTNVQNLFLYTYDSK